MRTFSLPDQRGHVGQFLQTNGSNVLWASGGGGTGVVESITAGTGIDVDSTDPAHPIVSIDFPLPVPGGANTNIQFNDSGGFGGVSDFTFNKATNTFLVADGGNSQFLVDPANGLYQLGDIDGVLNNSILNIDDVNQEFSLSNNCASVAGNIARKELFLGAHSSDFDTGASIDLIGSTTPAITTQVYSSGFTNDTSSVLHSSGYFGLFNNSADTTKVTELRFYEHTVLGTLNYTGFRGNDSRSGNIIYTLPATDPTAGQVLVAGTPSGGFCALSWVTL